MRAGRCPGLSCMFAIATLFAAPACLAQQAPAAAPADGTELDALVEQARAERASEQRSAFGRVMSIMIAALEQNADKPQAHPDESPAGQHGAAEPARDIQVSAAFRLDSEPARPPDPPATASLD